MATSERAALGLQKAPGMRVWCVAMMAVALVGCGVGADETYSSADGVIAAGDQTGSTDDALIGTEPATPVAPAAPKVPEVTGETPAAPPVDSTIALPQDPIPVLVGLTVDGMPVMLPAIELPGAGLPPLPPPVR